MKVGDTFPVTLAGHEVAQARVTSMEDGIAVLRFDGKEVKMSYVTQLAPDAPAPVEQPTTQHIVDEVVRTPNGESAPVGEGEQTVTHVDSVAADSTTDVSGTTSVEGSTEVATGAVEPQEITPAPESQS